MRIKPPQDSKGYALDLAEPYINDDGNPSAALIWNVHFLHLRTIQEWKETEPEIGGFLEAMYFSGGLRPWRYPTTPVLPETYEDVQQLHIEIQRCNSQYIEFPDSAWPSVFTTWLMTSYMVIFIDRSPLLIIFGPSQSGKGQVLDQVDRLGYHGRKMVSPTPAILFRLADKWKPTFALDELQDSDRESFREVMTIIKGSYDGTPVYRCHPNTHEVEAFQTRALVALSLKGSHPAEDVKNRSIMCVMRQNEEPKGLVPDDSDEHRSLRARLLGLRLKALIDPNFLEEALRTAQEKGEPETLGFDRRARDIALALLPVAVMSGQADELIETLTKSSAEARDEDNSTFIARVQHCLEEEMRIVPEKEFVSVLAVRDRVQYDLEGDGESRRNEKLPTRRVTNALKTLGYVLERRTHNLAYINRSLRSNISAFEINCRKYPLKETG